jgi:hypothetical protein
MRSHLTVLVVGLAIFAWPAGHSARAQQAPAKQPGNGKGRAAPAPAPRTEDGKVDLSGVWIVSEGLEIPGNPPYRPVAQKLWEERKRNAADDPAKYCLPNGVVRMTSRPYKIVQTEKLVVLLSEGNTHSYRRFFLDGRPHNLDLEPNSWTGDSIAQWEGDTLVVDSIGFNDRTWLDDTGKPHSEDLHVVERYRRPTLDRLEIEYTIEDPKALLKPFTFARVLTLLPDRDLQEYFCTDTNRLAAK